MTLQAQRLRLGHELTSLALMNEVLVHSQLPYYTIPYQHYHNHVTSQIVITMESVFIATRRSSATSLARLTFPGVINSRRGCT